MPNIIDVTAEYDQERGIAIQVSDTGIGIEAEKLDSVFEPFTQIDSALSRQHNGTGLGLSVVKAIMERHEGTVEIRSTLGISTEVTVIFPPDRVIILEVPQRVDDINESEHQLRAPPRAVA